jgi:hypothetical protein
VEAANRRSMEEKPKERLNWDKSPGAMDMTFKETFLASEEARKGGRRRTRWGKGGGGGSEFHYLLLPPRPAILRRTVCFFS